MACVEREAVHRPGQVMDGIEAHPVFAYFHDPGPPEAGVRGRFSALRQWHGRRAARPRRGVALGIAGSALRAPRWGHFVIAYRGEKTRILWTLPWRGVRLYPKAH